MGSLIKRFLKTTKGKITAIASGVVLVGIIVAIVMIIINNNGYRSISVEDVVGTVKVVGQKNNGLAYKGEHLYDGDDVSVMEESELTLCVDKEKYVYAEQNTHFKVVNASNKEGSRVKIVLDKGSELNVLTAKLGAGDSYEVDTPNSTMSVRGTRFRMTVYTAEDGYTYTLLEVESGVVHVQLKTLSGEYNGVERDFNAGESALIRGGDDFSEFVTEEGEVVLYLDHNSLPKEGVPRLIELLKKKQDAKGNSDKEKAADDQDKEETLKDNKDPVLDNSVVVDNDKDTKDDKDKDNKDKDTKDTKDKKDTKDTKDTNNNTANNDTNNNTNNNDTNNNNNNNNNNNENQKEHTHTAGDWTVTKEPTCDSNGEKVKKCTGCGEVLETASIDALGHNFGEWATDTPATCESKGSEKRVCSRCKKEETRETSALGHNWAETSRTDPTCTASGSVDYKCSRCSKTKSETLSALGHDFSSWKPGRPATCGDEGTETEVCSRCGAESGNTRSIPATGNHNYQPTNEIRNEVQMFNPDGTVYGSRERKYHCDGCGQDDWRMETF